ncbi:MAG: hypothetical protein IJ884_02265, partial [Bacteroidales bacterium]|nr:hypothetical protein [Bacteroidales bacterium]
AAAVVTREDASLMRALFMDYPEDKRTWDEDTEFLYGKSILVAPVSTEDDTRSVYLPEGEWLDFWDGSRLKGGVSFTRTFARDHLPLYVKEVPSCPWARRSSMPRKNPGITSRSVFIRVPTALSPSMRTRATATGTSKAPVPPSLSPGTMRTAS